MALREHYVQDAILEPRADLFFNERLWERERAMESSPNAFQTVVVLFGANCVESALAGYDQFRAGNLDANVAGLDAWNLSSQYIVLIGFIDVNRRDPGESLIAQGIGIAGVATVSSSQNYRVDASLSISTRHKTPATPPRYVGDCLFVVINIHVFGVNDLIVGFLRTGFRPGIGRRAARGPSLLSSRFLVHHLR